MSRLINPGLGDLCDRLTVLSLKILHGAEQGRETKHWETEHASLLAQLRGRELTGPWFADLLGLGATNAALWHAEDDLRTLRQQGTFGSVESYGPAGMVAFRIQALNDQRAALIHSINKLAGDDRGQEK